MASEPMKSAASRIPSLQGEKESTCCLRRRLLSYKQGEARPRRRNHTSQRRKKSGSRNCRFLVGTAPASGPVYLRTARRKRREREKQRVVGRVRVMSALLAPQEEENTRTLVENDTNPRRIAGTSARICSLVWAKANDYGQKRRYLLPGPVSETK